MIYFILFFILVIAILVTKSTYLLALLIAIGLFGIFGQYVFGRFKWYQQFACREMHWHSYPNFDTQGFDGASVHAKCKWCGYEGMIDSQGNLF